MSIETLLIWSYLCFTLLAASMLCVAAGFVMHFFVPKAMLQTYFKPPYFSSTEVEIFTGFPLGYMRPNSGKKRGLTEAYKLAPLWFRRASKIIVSTFVLVSTPMFVLGIFLYLSFCLLHGHC
jgi:hypothetical protein